MNQKLNIVFRKLESVISIFLCLCIFCKIPTLHAYAKCPTFTFNNTKHRMCATVSTFFFRCTLFYVITDLQKFCQLFDDHFYLHCLPTFTIHRDNFSFISLAGWLLHLRMCVRMNEREISINTHKNVYKENVIHFCLIPWTSLNKN